MTERRAFTLIELLIAVALVGICSSIIFVSTAQVTEHQKMEGLLQRVADTYAAARGAAICNHRAVRVRYDLRRQRMVVLADRSDEPAAEVIMPKGVDLVSVTPSETEDAVTMTIAANGMGRTHLLVIKWKDRYRGTVTINGFTGQAEISVAELR